MLPNTPGLATKPGNGVAVPVAPSGAAGTIRQAAEAAAEVYAPTEVEKHAQVLIQAWEARLKEQTRNYVRKAMEQHRKGPEIAEPMVPVFPPYPYWGLFMAGPFQPLGAANGPFLPNKMIRADDPAFMLYAIWRNPGCVSWACPGPSACELMGGWEAQLWMRLGNLTTWSAGPAHGPINVTLENYPTCASFGWVPLTLPAPPDGQPDLYEINTTVDITGPGTVSFAGFATWAFDPDIDMLTPLLGTGPHWQFEVPVRFMVYTK